MKKRVSHKLWGRILQLLNALPDHPLKKNEILDIFYNGLTDASRDYLDSCVGSLFRERTPDEAEISTMLANYTFKGGILKKLGDPGVPTIPCSIKRNYVKTALCDLGAGVSVMPLSLYDRLELGKFTPTEISLQMADKSTAIHVGICEDVPVVVARYYFNGLCYS